MIKKIDENNIIPWLNEAMEAYKAAPDKIERIFMWCYSKGATNAMKAMEGDIND